MLVNNHINWHIEGDNFELNMGGHIIARTKTYRYLGLVIDEKFSWADHIQEVCSKLSQVAGVLFKIRSLLSREALMLLYHGLVSSKLRYGLVCWASANKAQLNKINVVHNKIITCMAFSKRCVRMWPLYCDLKILPLNILIDIEYAKTMYKFQHSLLPPVFNNYFNKPSHNYNTRYATSSDNFEVMRISTAKEKCMLKYIGPNVWKNIPTIIKQAPLL